MVYAAAGIARVAANGMNHALVLVTTTYPPVVGGSEVEGQRICAGLRARGWSVTVLCRSTPPMPNSADWIDERGTPVRQWGRGWPLRMQGYVHALGVAWYLWRHRASYQSVYFLMTGLQLATALPVARLLDKRIVMKFSGSNTIQPLTASLLGRLELAMLGRWAESVMVLNPAMAVEATAAGLPEGRLLWMPNPVDVDIFKPVSVPEQTEARRRLDLAVDAECVLFVGRLAPEKELGVLIEAFGAVAGRRPKAMLVLVGDGPMRSQLETQATVLGLKERVVFAGVADENGVRSWLAAADLFALLSSLEGFPVSLLEAMACGLPAVVSDIPANQQLIEDGRQGLVVELGDASAAARAIETLLASPELRSLQGSAGRALVAENYTSAQVIDRYERLLTTAAGRTSTR